MERNMNREVETIREKVHTTADAALFLCFQEVKGSHSKGVIRLPLLHYDIPFEGYGEMLLRMNRIYDLLGMPDAGSCIPVSYTHLDVYKRQEHENKRKKI